MERNACYLLQKSHTPGLVILCLYIKHLYEVNLCTCVVGKVEIIFITSSNFYHDESTQLYMHVPGHVT